MKRHDHAHNHHDPIPALKYSWLTRFYDPVVATTTREGTFRQKLLRQANIKPGNQILDLACGTGTFTLMLKTAYPDAIIKGLDGDPGILRLAKRKAEDAGVDVIFHEGLSYQLPYANEEFDIVFSSLFFHHLMTEEKLLTLAEVFRILKPGGAFHVCDWGPPGNRFSKATFTFVRLLDGFGVTRDNAEGRLPKFIENAGFIEVKTAGHVDTILGTLDLISAVKTM